MLKPREQWRPGMTYENLIQQMDEKLQFPGLTNTWTMPVENRLDMELTGIKTAVGIKIQGQNLAQIEDIGAHMQQILSTMPDTTSAFAERVSQGFYLNVEVNRPQQRATALPSPMCSASSLRRSAEWTSLRMWKAASASPLQCAISAISATILNPCRRRSFPLRPASRSPSAKWLAFIIHAAPP